MKLQYSINHTIPVDIYVFFFVFRLIIKLTQNDTMMLHILRTEAYTVSIQYVK